MSSQERDLAALRDAVRAFVAAREWEPYHDPKNLAMCVASEAGELVSELRWVRGEESDEKCQKPELRARIADEVGDVLISLLMFADRIDMDLIEAGFAKLDKNGLKYPVDKSCLEV